MAIRKYGWKPSKPDIRDYRLKTVDHSIYKLLPPSVDLSSIVPEVLDQEQEGSCTAHALSMAQRIARIKQGLPDFKVSRQFLYWNERFIEGTTDQDAGAEIRDGAKVLATLGIPRESFWPYEQSNMFLKPSDDAFKNAVQDEIKVYMTVAQTESEFKTCLAEGYPIVFGTTLYEAFESPEVASHGLVPDPGPNDKQIGGHAILCVGYNDITRRFKVLNSWGKDWGDKGYCYFTYDYLLNSSLTSDCWTLRSLASVDRARKVFIPKA